MVKKSAIVKQVSGLTLAAKADSDHWVIMDGPKEFKGNDAGARPKELLLMALGGCTASDVISILSKKRVPLVRIEVRLEAAVREEHPRVFTDIHIEYVIYGQDIDPADVERAIDLSSTKYCSVSAMLKPTVHITHSHRIETVAAEPAMA